MKHSCHVLIIKLGALGDVVRTSYFARSLREKYGYDLRLSWLTTKEARELLENNLNIDDVWTNFSDATGFLFDRIFCLEEDQAVVDAASTLNTRTFTGAVPDGKGSVGYTTDAAAWFDMSAISQFGRERADELKKSNRKGHAEIFKAVFGVESVRPELPGVPLGSEAQALRDEFPRLIGINRGAGDRWPSKTLEEKEPAPLIRQILEAAPEGGTGVVLLGAGRHRDRNLALAGELRDSRIRVPDTADSVMRFAALVGALDYLITSDSLALHLAIAQSVPFLAFFAPTSAAEIDDFGMGTKVTSTAADYCSYRRDADNSSITASRIIAAARLHRPELFPSG